MTDRVTFTVYGTPQPAGSKRALPAGGRTGGRPIIVDAARGSRPWKQQVAGAAIDAMHGRPPLDGPLVLELLFVVSRPKGHQGRRGLLPSAPARPAKRPDVLKLARAVEDALSGIAYGDDAQIVDELLAKVYGQPARVQIVIRPAANRPLEAT